MKPETLEWINKAEGDWAVAQREMQAPLSVWNVVCFLAQQCAEKFVLNCEIQASITTKNNRIFKLSSWWKKA